MEAYLNGHRHWLRLGLKAARLWLRGTNATPDLVRCSYDRLAFGYDETWTDHMRTFSIEMLDRLAPSPDATCIDLACGTGFITGELARRTSGRVVGVDSSSGMLDAAREKLSSRCAFVQADVLEYLRSLPRSSVDIITCAWALGYTRPWLLLREVVRVLRTGGQVAIIDNTLFSLAGVLWASILTVAEDPEALVHVMRVRFLPATWCLTLLMRTAGLSVRAAWSGERTYHVLDGNAAIARLTATGAAAGFEFASDESRREAIFGRFARILEDLYQSPEGIPITHRYLAAIGTQR